MYGAILGDIIGSPFEFDRGDKTKEFDLFTKGCDFTDDSVMTIAVGEALLAVGPQLTCRIGEEDIHMQDMVGSLDIGLKKKIQNHTEAMEMVQP